MNLVSKAEREKLRSNVGEYIKNRRFIKKLDLFQEKLPSPPTVRNTLEQIFNIYSNREFRVILVEDFKDYKIFITPTPNGKSKHDFYVWYAKFSSNNTLTDWDIPTHDYLGNWYKQLKGLSNELEEYMINSVLRLIRDREGVYNIVAKYYSTLKEDIKKETIKFLSTLKWITLEEDANYPPPEYLGSKYALAVYSLLEAGFNIKDVRKIIRF